VVIPAGSCLVALSPDDPVQVMGDVVAGVGEQVEQSFDLGDGERDQPDVLGWLLVGVVGEDGLWSSGFLGGGGDRADGEGGHGEHDVAQHGGVEADLTVVESEVVLAAFERFLDRPAQAGDPHQGGEGDRAPGWDVAVVVGQLAAAQVFADEHVVGLVGGAQPDRAPTMASGPTFDVTAYTTRYLIVCRHACRMAWRCRKSFLS